MYASVAYQTCLADFGVSGRGAGGGGGGVTPFTTQPGVDPNGGNWVQGGDDV